MILVFDGNKSDKIGEMKEIWRLIFEVRYFLIGNSVFSQDLEVGWGRWEGGFNEPGELSDLKCVVILEIAGKSQ